MTEAELQALVIDAARLHGWYVFHDRDSRGNAAGFPDLVLIQPPRVLFVELKSPRGRVRQEQAAVLELLAECDTISSGIVRPADADRLITALAG
jgi:hypothetical protein